MLFVAFDLWMLNKDPSNCARQTNKFQEKINKYEVYGETLNPSQSYFFLFIGTEKKNLNQEMCILHSH
jgi:hypothetical protein